MLEFYVDDNHEFALQVIKEMDFGGHKSMLFIQAWTELVDIWVANGAGGAHDIPL